MSAWLIGVVTLLYTGAAVGLYFEGRNGMCLMFVGYAIANVGLIYDIMKG